MTDDMTHAPVRRWRWLHRMGYVCTLIVLAELLWAGTLLTMAWWQQRQRSVEMLAHSRVHDGPILSDPKAIDLSSKALSRLASLRPVTRLGPNAVRLAVEPAMSDIAYALALRRQGDKAEGLALVFRHQPDGTEERRAYHFQAPLAEFDQIMTQFDLVTDGYEGGDRRCTDGVQYAFERRRGTRVTSGTSTSNCDRTYERAAAILSDFGRHFAPVPNVYL